MKAHPYRTVATNQGPMVLIDGKEHPEAIPEHSLWAGLFEVVARAKRTNDLALLEWIGIPHRLSAPEAAVLYREAEAQDHREKLCRDETAAMSAMLKAREDDPSFVAELTAAQLIRCRHRTLDAGDRVVEALSPQGRELVHAWMEAERRRRTLYVAERELDHYKLPR